MAQNSVSLLQQRVDATDPSEWIKLFTAKQLRTAGKSAKMLKSARFTPRAIMALGYSSEELRDAGFKLQDATLHHPMIHEDTETLELNAVVELSLEGHTVKETAALADLDVSRVQFHIGW